MMRVSLQKKHYSIEMMNYLSIIHSMVVTIPILPRPIPRPIPIPIPIPQYCVGIVTSLILSSIDIKHSALK